MTEDPTRATWPEPDQASPSEPETYQPEPEPELEPDTYQLEPEPATYQAAEDPGYLAETGQVVGDDGSVVPIIGGLPAAEGSAWDIGAPLADRGAGLAEQQGSPAPEQGPRDLPAQRTARPDSAPVVKNDAEQARGAHEEEPA